MASDASRSVFDTHLLVVLAKSQMPPWAAPRIHWPFRRIASAPMRPLFAVGVPELKAIWLVGFGPSPVQRLLKDAPAGAFRIVLLAESAASPRRCPASSIESALSPAVRAAMNA